MELPNAGLRLSLWQPPGQEPSPLQSSTLPWSAVTPFLFCHISAASAIPCHAWPSSATCPFLNQAGTSTRKSKATGLVSIPTFPVVLCNPSNSFTCSKRIMKGESNPAPAALAQFPNSLSWANLRKSKATKKEQLCPYTTSPTGICCCNLISITS